MRTLLIVTALVLIAHTGAAQVNLLVNPDFDTDLSGWSFFPGPGSSVTWDAMDVDALATSGSLRVEVDWMDNGNALLVSQCVLVGSAETVTISGWVFNPSTTPDGSTFLRMQWYRDEICGIGTGNTDSSESFEEDVWAFVAATDAILPPGTVSGRLYVTTFEDSFQLENEVAFWDSISVVPEPSVGLTGASGAMLLAFLSRTRSRSTGGCRISGDPTG